ncbi:thioredoxin Y1, chloroplastic-like [Cucurbita maxima]|uniref:Thioredoxin Y1, chloroplastic-like n=1 Tax=Cucurbita maxima TaxID=3661 RepID=A0A6J1I964_CUCMA|nr:thioredoxin Y1, chloroplastic-like [Cucurbita maxima]XP_022974038.1 thioredoxin Y1, chloroplastic-like [Cucurbita maxima]
MAASISTSPYPLLTSERSNRFAANDSSSSRLFSSSSLQLPVQLRCVRLGNCGISAPSRSRIFPVVKAKNQTFSSFDDLLANSDKPVLVDFYATWCGPCQFMVPILEKVSDALSDTVQVVKIDTEKYPVIADKYKIEALPTFILFKDGKPLDRFEGALAAGELIQRIENSLKVKQ